MAGAGRRQDRRRRASTLGRSRPRSCSVRDVRPEQQPAVRIAEGNRVGERRQRVGQQDVAGRLERRDDERDRVEVVRTAHDPEAGRRGPHGRPRVGAGRKRGRDRAIGNVVLGARQAGCGRAHFVERRAAVEAGDARDLERRVERRSALALAYAAQPDRLGGHQIDVVGVPLPLDGAGHARLHGGAGAGERVDQALLARRPVSGRNAERGEQAVVEPAGDGAAVAPAAVDLQRGEVPGQPGGDRRVEHAALAQPDDDRERALELGERRPLGGALHVAQTLGRPRGRGVGGRVGDAEPFVGKHERREPPARPQRDQHVGRLRGRDAAEHALAERERRQPFAAGIGVRHEQQRHEARRVDGRRAIQPGELALRGRGEVVAFERAPPQERPRRGGWRARRLDVHRGQAQREIRAEAGERPVGRLPPAERLRDRAVQPHEAVEPRAGVGDPCAERVALVRRVERGDGVEEVGEAPRVLAVELLEEPLGRVERHAGHRFPERPRGVAAGHGDAAVADAETAAEAGERRGVVRVQPSQRRRCRGRGTAAWGRRARRGRRRGAPRGGRSRPP